MDPAPAGLRETLITDSLIEATNEAKDSYSEERETRGEPSEPAALFLQSFVTKKSKDPRKFVAGTPQANDLTIMSIRYHR